MSYHKQSVSAVLFVALLTQLTWIPTSRGYSSALNNRASTKSNDAEAWISRHLSQLALEEPVVEEFFNSAKETQNLTYKFNIDDPSLDKNPFFLRGQNWQSRNGLIEDAKSTSLFAKTENDSVVISSNLLNTELKISAPLKPLLQTEDYVLFSLNKNSGNVHFEEGLFFISTEEFYTSAKTKMSLPVYFMPLPGRGWDQPLYVSENPVLPVFTLISDQADHITFDLADLEKLHKYQKLNLALVTGQALLVAAKLGQNVENKQIYPPRGSTAVFGSFVTGLDLDNPGLSVFSPGISSGANLNQFGKYALAQISKGSESATAFINTLFNNTAHADPSVVLPLKTVVFDDKMIGTLYYVIGILSALFIASYIMKYTALRTKFNKIYADELRESRGKIAEIFEKIDERVEQKNKGSTNRVGRVMNRLTEELKSAPTAYPKAAWIYLTQKDERKKVHKRIGIEFKQIGDSYAAATTTLSQIPNIIPGQTIDYLLDKNFPSVAGDHTTIRKILNNTILYSLRAAKRIPVNWKTFLFGTLIMGSIDTALVYAQWVWVVPMTALAMAPYLTEGLRSRVMGAFDPLNVDNSILATKDTIRNGLAYAQSGALYYAQKVKTALQGLIEREVDQDLIRQGKNPLDPKLKSYREGLIEEKLNRALAIRGLPGPDKFVGDLSTIIENQSQRAGFLVGDAERAGRHYILEKRFGLTTSVLDRVIEIVKATKETHLTNSEINSVLALAEETKRDMKYLTDPDFNTAYGDESKTDVKKRISEMSERAKKVRMTLTMLSYEGEIAIEEAMIPTLWNDRYSKDTVRTFADLFRTTLLSYLMKNGNELLLPNTKQLKEYDKEASIVATEELIKRHQLEIEALNFKNIDRNAPKFAEVVFVLQTTFPIEFKLEYGRAIHKFVNDKEKNEEIAKFAPRKKGLIERSRIFRVSRETSKIVTTIIANNPKIRKNEISRIWNEEYARQMAADIGLYAPQKTQEKYTSFIEHINEKAAESLESQLKDVVGLKEYLAKLTPEMALLEKAHLFTESWLKTYIDTASNKLDALDPAQPGKYQKVRQSEKYTTGKKSVRLIRTLEASYDDQDVSLGLRGILMRNVWGLSDFVNAHTSYVRTMPNALIFGYLWTYYFWQVQQPYGFMLMFVLTAPATIVTPSLYLDRIARLNGVETQKDLKSQILYYALPYPWFTFAGMYLIMPFKDDAQFVWEKFIREPFVGAITAIPTEAYLLALGLISTKIILNLNGFYREYRANRQIRKNEHFSRKNKCIDIFAVKSI